MQKFTQLSRQNRESYANLHAVAMPSTDWFLEGNLSDTLKYGRMQMMNIVKRIISKIKSKILKYEICIWTAVNLLRYKWKR